MKFIETKLQGLWLIEWEPRLDERGFFTRTYCEHEFSARGLNTKWTQGNLTRTSQRGTIRGLHWQAEPKPEIKLVRCSAGAIWDVAVDIRRDSPTYGHWAAFELTSDNGMQLYIPAGYAHGFQCLTENSQVDYQMGEFYFPELARGLRWDDPQVGISWPLDSSMLSDRDKKLPLLSDSA